jgi:shikimate kinase
MEPKGPNIILAGFMGTGKTVVGYALAKRLGWSFIDADALIETRARKPITRIFAEDGEAAFREIETEAAREIAGLKRHVVATGGGMIVGEENRRILEGAGTTVLLEASEETIWKRVGHQKHRPLLAGDNPRKMIRDLLEARKEAYGKIGIRIATDGKSVTEIVEEVAGRIGGA